MNNTEENVIFQTKCENHLYLITTEYKYVTSNIDMPEIISLPYGSLTLKIIYANHLTCSPLEARKVGKIAKLGQLKCSFINRTKL